MDRYNEFNGRVYLVVYFGELSSEKPVSSSEVTSKVLTFHKQAWALVANWNEGLAEHLLFISLEPRR